MQSIKTSDCHKNYNFWHVFCQAQWGYLNKQGKTIIPHKFDSGGEFSEGVAVVKYEGKWVCINTKGNILVQLGEVE